MDDLRPSGTAFVGTSGWSYKDWVGPFYPDGARSGDWLALYAERFAAVEVDSTFYAVPRRSTVEGWAARTPPEFRFALKLPGLITHGAAARGAGAAAERIDVERVLRDASGALERFLEAIEPLGPRLGPIVFQFPYFRVGAIEPADFLGRLDAALEGVPRERRVAVEVRNKAWLGADLAGLLRRRAAAAVLLDHPYLPPPREQLDLGLVTADFSYVRLLGDRYGIEKITRAWDKTVVDRSERLDTWADLIHDLLGRPGVREVYTFANNHYAGHGPATARALLERLAGRPAGDR